jgi:hypothetical protein
VRAIREDRILDEVLATGGDLRRLCDLFGLSVKAAHRYTALLDHPDLVDLDKSQASHPKSDPAAPPVRPGGA